MVLVESMEGRRDLRPQYTSPKLNAIYKSEHAVTAGRICRKRDRRRQREKILDTRRKKKKTTMVKKRKRKKNERRRMHVQCK